MSTLENMVEDFILIINDSVSLLTSSYPHCIYLTCLLSEFISGNSYLEISDHEIPESQKKDLLAVFLNVLCPLVAKSGDSLYFHLNSPKKKTFHYNRIRKQTNPTFIIISYVL